jgi:hypothetical protein
VVARRLNPTFKIPNPNRARNTDIGTFVDRLSLLIVLLTTVRLCSFEQRHRAAVVTLFIRRLRPSPLGYVLQRLEKSSGELLCTKAAAETRS